MNERIKSLLAKAHLDVMEDLGNLDTNQVAEKFAELLIKECMGVALKHTPYIELCDYSWLIYDKIKEHFGIEELRVCKHEWYSAKNQYVLNGSVCFKCYAIDQREPEELKNDSKV